MRFIWLSISVWAGCESALRVKCTRTCHSILSWPFSHTIAAFTFFYTPSKGLSTSFWSISRFKGFITFVESSLQEYTIDRHNHIRSHSKQAVCSELRKWTIIRFFFLWIYIFHRHRRFVQKSRNIGTSNAPCIGKETRKSVTREPEQTNTHKGKAWVGKLAKS